MPGVPKTKRCERCRRRKIKCDENWPTCTSCKRSDAVCSGPLIGVKFVTNGYATTHVIASNPATPSGGREHASWHRFRVHASPQSSPSSPSDRVASHLVGHLEQSVPIRDFLLIESGCFTLLPARLGESTALRDCTALFASTWAKFRRGLSIEDVTDRQLYGKALRSLHSALNKQQFNCQTLAAITVMERFEIMFDPGRPLNWSAHRKGMITLMATRGPPTSGDEMDIILALDNYLLITTHRIVKGGEDFYDETWMVVMKDAINHRIKASELRKGAYYLDLFMGNWASAVQDMRLVCDDTDPELKKARAAALKDRATGLAADLARFSEPIMERACNQGHIVTLPDLGCPVGLKYNFSGMDAHRFLWTYALLRIVFNRILWAVETILSGNNAASLDVEHQSFCRYIWMCLPFTLNVSPMAAILFSDPLFTSYEGARGAIKEYLLTTVIEIAQYRKRLSNDRDKVDNYLLATARAMTGREFFRERTDFPYWQQSSKVVME